MRLRPVYRPWFSRYHDMVQREQTNPIEYANPIEKPERRNFLSKALLRLGRILGRGKYG